MIEGWLAAPDEGPDKGIYNRHVLIFQAAPFGPVKAFRTFLRGAASAQTREPAPKTAGPKRRPTRRKNLSS